MVYSSKLKSRPTTDFAREGVFNLLESRIDFDGIDFLDLFAGTGCIGFEAYSRGAHVVGVDVDIWSQRGILDIVKDWGLDRYRFHRADVFRFLKKVYQKQFDVVFADAPFSFPTTLKLPDLVLEGKWLKPGGLLVIEHGKDKDFSKHPKFDSSRSFGNVIFSFFNQDS